MHFCNNKVRAAYYKIIADFGGLYMKVNSTILLELSKKELELLNKEYTRNVAKIIASNLSLQEINQLIEKLMIN